MRGDGFEWDDEKAARNLAKHDISFEMARDAFGDTDSRDEDDPDPHEVRTKPLCRSGTRILVVVWTQRDDRVRIISARPATKHEQRTYFEG